MKIFDLGEVVITRNCIQYCQDNDIDPIIYIKRHASGDWGDIIKADQEMNQTALKTKQDRLFSAYLVQGIKLYCITEHDYTVTTLMLSSDY
jgi:hypothetical protein